MLKTVDNQTLGVAAKAEEAAMFMRVLANEHRLLILCHLVAAGELQVGELVQRIGLSQSALSQHLARLRNEGLVGFRREAQALFYRVTDERANQVLQLLQDIFCPELPRGRLSGKSRMADNPPAPDTAMKGANDGRSA